MNNQWADKYELIAKDDISVKSRKTWFTIFQNMAFDQVGRIVVDDHKVA